MSGSAKVGVETAMPYAPMRRRLALYGLLASSIPSARYVVLVDLPGSIPFSTYWREHPSSTPLRLLPLGQRLALSVDDQRALIEPVGEELADTALADEDLELELRQPNWPGVQGFSKPPLLLRARRPDGILDGLHDLHHLHLADPGRNSSILDSSRVLLGRHRPGVTILSSSGCVDDTAAARSLLESIGYRCFDLAGGLAGELTTEVLAIHPEGPKVLAHIPVRLAALAADESLTLSAARANDRRHADAGDLPGWLAAEAWDWQRVIGSGEISGSGWYASEEGWRWSGPDPWCEFLIAAPAPGRLVISMHLVNAAASSVPWELRLFVDGLLVPSSVTGVERDWFVKATVTVKAEALHRPLRLRIAHASTARIDHRELGICADRVTLSWLPVEETG